MASAEKLPSGRWRGLYVDSAGKKQRVPGTFARKSDARDAAIDAQAKAKRQAAASNGTLSARTPWGQWWEAFNADREFDSDHASTEAKAVRNHVMPKWEDVPLNAISKHGENGVQPWVDSLCRKGYSAHYVRNIVKPFRTSINAAVDRKILTASPCVRLKLPRVPKVLKAHTSTDEAAGMKDVGKLNPRYADALDFQLETGMRPGELCGLHANRIDRRRRILLVAEVLVEERGMIRFLPKDGDQREIPLTTKALEILDRQMEMRDITGGCGLEHLDGSECNSVLVWLDLAGGHMTPHNLSRRYREAAKAAGIPLRSGYASRRGFATRAIDGGADIFAVQAIMGHADLDQLAEYKQFSAEARQKLFAALGERPPLSAVTDGDVGQRGMKRGTDSDNQPLPDVPDEDVTDAS
ncbi:tyrosine-type recombinase/integrase [Amycolatopsis magusensis]|uniref:tyrosine-type recombinase/integrase n=1 Tax=Amycolatopsis magusensis TaxID=882444 RepID=UPI003C2D0CF2